LVDKAIQRAIEMKELRAENQDLDRMLLACEEDSQEELAKANRQEEYLESRIEHYMQKTGDALEENDKLKKKLEEAEKKVEQLNVEIQETKKEAEIWKNRADDWQNEAVDVWDKTEKATEGLTMVLSRVEEKYTKLYEEQQETKKEAEMWKSMADDWKADCESLDESRDQLEDYITAQDEIIQTWEKAHNRARDEVQRMNDELFRAGAKLDKARMGIKKLTEVKQDLESKLDTAQMVIGQQQQSLADKDAQIEQQLEKIKMHGKIGVFYSRDHVTPAPGRFAIVLGSPAVAKGSKKKMKKTELWFATLGQVNSETKEAQIGLYYAWKPDHDNPETGTMHPCNNPKDAPKPGQKLPYGTYYCIDRFPSGPKEEYDEFIAEFCEDVEPVDNCTRHSEADHAARRRRR
jgi:predicted  nucleic acid-binding Zn-ribbon protein